VGYRIRYKFASGAPRSLGSSEPSAPKQARGTGDVAPAILFKPTAVQDVLAGLPSLAALLPDPTLEGDPSEAFPGVLRKTDRELYRWIANPHYQHLAEPLAQLERAHAAGCTFGSLLTTRDREQFISLTSEAFVAEDLLRRGYSVTTVLRQGAAVPDIHVVADGIDIAVEVYRPRELLAVDDWVKELTDLFQYVDVQASFSSSVHTRLDPTTLPRPDPWAVADMLAQTRDVVLEEITLDVEAALRKLRSLNREYAHEGTPLVTTVEVDDVQPAPALGPVRRGTHSPPGFSGYSPAGVFATVVDRTKKKARRRQTHGFSAAIRALVVDLMGVKIAGDLVHQAHTDEAKLALTDVDPQEYGLDVIAFMARVLPQGLAAIFTVFDDTTLTAEQVQALFGRRP
jgi:hypothetical protein